MKRFSQTKKIKNILTKKDSKRFLQKEEILANKKDLKRLSQKEEILIGDHKYK